MELFSQNYPVPETGLGPGDLFRLIQEVSAAHCRTLGYGEPVMEEKGLMWVIVRHGVELQRSPVPGELLCFRTWPGPTRHGMCPRWYRIEDAAGALVISGCAIWSVVDRRSRKMVVPAERGVEIPAQVTGLESRRPAAPGKLPLTESAEFRVDASVLDENGHMNNTRYYDLAEGCLGTRGRALAGACAEYLAEAREGDLLRLQWGREGDRFFLAGELDGPAFRMELRYR
jgi:acyl-ACP thioesterase